METEAETNERLSVMHKPIRGADKGCPWCLVVPDHAVKRPTRYIVGCENESCVARPQVAGESIDAAWNAWNSCI